MQRNVPDYQAIQSFRLFAQACFGVVIGVLLAVAIARLLLPPDGPAQTIPEGMLSWNLHRVFLKPREKGFYLLSLVLGGAGAYFATYRIITGRIIQLALWAVLLLSVPIGNHIISNTLLNSAYSPAIPICIALIASGLFVTLMLTRGHPLAAVAQWSGKAEAVNDRRLWPFLLALLLITLILIPSSFKAVAERIGLNDHPVWFLFGPALYFLGENLLPGIDYYTQYSIGQPWLFHFIMGKSAERMVLNYAIFVILATWFFYAHLIYLLHRLYRSWIAAALVALAPLILSFHYPEPIPAHFFAPSSSILRYPLLTVCAALAGFWAESPRDPVRLLAIACATAVAIFLETESGIVMLVTASLALFLVYPWRSSIALPIVGFLVATSVILVLVLFAVFGPGALQLAFFQRLFEGILYYGSSGFGGTPRSWTLTEWNWLYHFVAPGASIATIGVIARACGSVDVDRRQAATLGFLAASGVLLLVKASNQSIAAVWQMSAIGPLVVLGWWCVAVLNHIRPEVLRRHVYFGVSHDRTSAPPSRVLGAIVSLRRAVAVAMVVVAVIFLRSPSESRSPGLYGLKAWAEYPSLLRRIFYRPGGCSHNACMMPNFPPSSDIALIESLTRPREQVAVIVDLYDWMYLIKAQRPPLMYFLPFAITFSKEHLQESLRRLATQNYIFITKGPGGNRYNPYPVTDDVKAAVEPLLGTVFQKVGESDRLVAWKRVVPQ
jgi:hypothetical protein